jgi:hypothetical protein
MERLLEARIDGRVTAEAVASLARSVQDLLDGDGPFAVVLDRRSMTAPTADGRRALQEWAAASLPRLAGRCAAWADVLDERRVASLARAGSADRAHLPYPQRTFSDPDEARGWAAGALREALTA